MGRKKKISTFDIYLELCWGKKIIINGKAYGYRNINRGKTCSLNDFKKFLAKKLDLDTRDMDQYSQMNFLDMLEYKIA